MPAGAGQGDCKVRGLLAFLLMVPTATGLWMGQGRMLPLNLAQVAAPASAVATKRRARTAVPVLVPEPPPPELPPEVRISAMIA
mgnify:CR=1 FL=1